MVIPLRGLVIPGLYWLFETVTTGSASRVERSMTLAAAPNLARIPAGDFLMGAADAEADERPVHRVTVG